MADRTRVLNFKRGKPGKIVAKHGPFTIRCLAADEYELLVYGDIGDSWMGESVTAAAVVKELQTVEAKTIHVRINSYGGSVSDGLAIFNALRRHGADIQTHVDGVAYSIASLIAMAGDTVTIAENALLMIHAPWGALAGNAAQLREFADTLDIYAEAMVSAYTRKTGADSQSRVEQLLKDGKDHYFTAGEAVAEGFADQTTAALAVAASARFNLSRFTNQPAAAAAFHQEADMNFKTLAAALGIKLARGSDDNTIKAKVLQHLELKADATDEQVQAALDQRNVTDPAGATADPPEAPLTAAATRQAVVARNGEIRQAFGAFRHREDIAELEVSCLADANLTIEAVRNKLLAKLGEGAEPLNGGLPRVSGGKDSGEKRREAMVVSLLARSGVRKDPETGKEIVFDGANPFRNHSLRELARASLEAAGINTRGMDVLTLARAALVGGRVHGASQGTSDFPVILQDVMHKEALRGMQAYAPTYLRFCKVGDVSDFRSWARLVPGLLGNLDTVNEQGEYVHKNIPDATKNSIAATRKGNIVSITPEAIVNDDLALITDFGRQLGAAGPRAVDRAVFALLALNGYAGPTLTSDSLTLIHATHNNTQTGAASVATLATMANAMATQTAPGVDAEPLDIQPAVSVSNRLVAGDIQTVVEAQYDPDTANKLQRPNKVRGLLKDIVGSARAPATKFWLFADPAVAPAIEVVFLNGQRETRIVTEENFNTGGLSARGELPFGVGAIDYRGVQYSTGA